ncbi:DegT/DnrJ/EryC1/StrS family aminotransferase [Saccharopolyspora sp. NFXS83]|uniref:DegT/DnrJ/EryC1/StrS family aminotransferase n=1 Tax=Saccharopolyspora sp. NFXS83 TaxID=2993560 RepID=UPI00224AD8D4|nr:DegT/DnrJ/EryC1/StrS family aminotransferase [Saccharopolyspora sp. NFXS83]MCX2731039.1 DegT/DnrJ/EryC1/StrS family aminotransferase [Saccharopolyspora sp. NFXS83]
MTAVGRPLAVLGGTPAFAEKLHVGKPNISNPERVLDLVKQAMDSYVLTHSGPLVTEFERRIADAAGVAHCVALCNASIGLQIMARVLGLHGEVIMPSYTFIATAHTMRWEGLTPIFCDVDLTTGQLDPEEVQRLITPRTTAILGVHLWGNPAPVDALAGIAAEHGLALFYDSAHAFGSAHQGKPIGGFGRAEVFSFHATKFLNASEGGAVVTDDPDLAAHVRALHNYGRDKAGVVQGLGTNAKMTELAAAMGLASLEGKEELIRVNTERHAHYAAGLDGVPGISLRRPEAGDRVNHSYVVMEVDSRSAGLSRDQVITALHAENVLGRDHFHPGCHRTPPYAGAGRLHAPRPLPRTETLSARVVLLPTGLGISVEQVDEVCAVVRALVEQAPAVRDTLV